MSVEPTAAVARAEAEQVYLAKVLIDIRSKMVIFADEIEDEGDRVYLGSTNHKDEIEEILEILNEVDWSRTERDAKPRDIYAELRQLRTSLQIVRDEARFLTDRLASLEWCDLEQTTNDFYGHVQPSIARLTALLADVDA